MNLYSLSSLTDDFVVYRNLEPFDPRVPGVGAAWREMGLAGPAVVRKRDPGYPQAAAWILRRFHELQAPGVAPRELLLIGDTLGNDGAAYQRLAHATGWAGSAFIGSEQLQHPPEAYWTEDIFVANRWQGLADWLGQLQGRGLSMGEETIVIVDIDKTALGARGRNHRPIDTSRLVAMGETVRQALGPEVDLDSFAAIYHELNQTAYHDLTGDNQDYLAYISIMAGAGIISMEELRQAHAAGDLNAFAAFMALMQDRRQDMPPALAALHQEVTDAYHIGDPTPFKGFRRNEYRATVAAMGNLPDDAPDSERMEREICLTREVWDACKWLQARGALITSFSDKPDEACAPAPELVAEGYEPIHRTGTHLLGQPLELFSR